MSDGDTPALDAVDRGILACLREDGRMSSSTIARRLDIGESTVRRRIERLEQTCDLRLVPVIDPDRIGLETCVFVGLTVEPDAVEDVAARVRALPEVRYLAYTTGRWDLLAEAFVGSRDHLADFLLSDLGRLPGVRAAETFNVLRIAKFGYEWEIPEPSPGRRGASIAHPGVEPATPPAPPASRARGRTGR